MENPDMNMSMNMNRNRNRTASATVPQAAGSLTPGHPLAPSLSSMRWPPAAIDDIISPYTPANLGIPHTTTIPTLGRPGDFPPDMNAELDFAVKPAPFPPAYWAGMPMPGAYTARNASSDRDLDLALGLINDDFVPSNSHGMQELQDRASWDSVPDIPSPRTLQYALDGFAEFPMDLFSMPSHMPMNNMPALYTSDFDLMQPTTSTVTNTVPGAIPSSRKPEANTLSSANMINSISSQGAATSSDPAGLELPTRIQHDGGPPSFPCHSPWSVAGSPDLSFFASQPGSASLASLGGSYQKQPGDNLAIGLLDQSPAAAWEAAAFGTGTGPTVSPKDLKIQPSPRHFSSTESMSMLASFNDTSSVGSVDGGAAEMPNAYSGRVSNLYPIPSPPTRTQKQPTTLNTQPHTTNTSPKPKTRKQLPDAAPPKPRTPSSATPSNRVGASASATTSNRDTATKTHGRHSQRPVHPSPYPPPSITRRSPSTTDAVNINTASKLPTSNITNKSPRPPGSPTRTPRHAHRYDAAPAVTTRILPRQESNNSDDRSANSNIKSNNTDSDNSPDPDLNELAKKSDERTPEEKNQILLKLKSLGMTYKEIKIIGEFTEPESTLRGRFRTLSKEQKQRVRKPTWTERDIHLLERGVRKHLPAGSDLRQPTGSLKIPWKVVAEYIAANGGSYKFGNSTCRKRWDELVAEQVHQLGKDIRRPFWGQ
ncbi:hypothetical protein B0T19DRAFT_457022 [Cercophora scortea]|uniref:Myb-like domain-containing protein n=1 Tax=Cercophora scortea TaxID=314031 RepID=A0AAE0IWC8_9PEZI|nr:hypothetical protein B0T19DRAFT_457022 [Cercophora scortea]